MSLTRQDPLVPTRQVFKYPPNLKIFKRVDLLWVRDITYYFSFLCAYYWSFLVLVYLLYVNLQNMYSLRCVFSIYIIILLSKYSRSILDLTGYSILLYAFCIYYFSRSKFHSFSRDIVLLLLDLVHFSVRYSHISAASINWHTQFAISVFVCCSVVRPSNLVAWCQCFLLAILKLSTKDMLFSQR